MANFFKRSIFNNRVNVMPPDYIPDQIDGIVVQDWVIWGGQDNPAPRPQGPGNSPPGGQPPRPPQGPGNPPPGGQPPRPPQGPGAPPPIVANQIRPCKGKFTYLWLRNGSEFWFFVQDVTPNYLVGWRINQGRRQYGRISLNSIVRFYCNN